MKTSIALSLKNMWLPGFLILIVVAWGCSDSTSSFSEEEINKSVTAHSGSGKAQGPMLQENLFTIVDQPQFSPEQQRMLSII